MADITRRSSVLLSQDGAPQGCFADAPIGYFSVYDSNSIRGRPAEIACITSAATRRRGGCSKRMSNPAKLCESSTNISVPDNQMDNPPVLAWTSDLHYLTIGAGENMRVQQGMPVLLVAIDSGQIVDLAHIPGTEGNSPFVVCPYFSPGGTYLTAYNFDVPETPAQPQFLILDKQGTIVTIIRPSAPLNVLPMSCPTWQTDETAFYFPLSQGSQQSSSLRILKYSLDSQQFSVAFDSGTLDNPAEATVISRMSLSPDEQFLAFDSPFDPAANDGTRVTVISLAQASPMLQHYSAPFHFSSDPLWDNSQK